MFLSSLSESTSPICCISDDCLDPRRLPLLLGRVFFLVLVTELSDCRSGNAQYLLSPYTTRRPRPRRYGGKSLSYGFRGIDSEKWDSPRGAKRIDCGVMNRWRRIMVTIITHLSVEALRERNVSSSSVPEARHFQTI